MKIKVNDKEDGVAEVMKNGNTYIPVLSIKMMTDEMWNELANKNVPCDLAGYTKGRNIKLN